MVLQVRSHDFDGVFTIEGVGAGEGVVENAAESIEIDALVDGNSFELFRPHEIDGAENAIGLVDGLEGGFGGEFGEAEINDLHLELT